MMSQLANRVVIITGASSGIGKACAEEFARAGANIVLAARQYVKCCEIAEELHEKYNIKAIAVATDVSKEEDCRLLISQAIQTFGRIDVLVNNAGISMRALFEDVNLEVIRQVMDINFWGTVYCTKYALPEIVKSQGSVVGISSIAGHKGLPARTGYSASKFAMQGFLEAVRIETMKKGVHVLVVCPGFTASNIRQVALSKDGSPQGESPLDEKKIMQAEEVAKKIVHAVAHRKRDLALTIQGKLTVWVNKFFPSFMDRMVFNHFAKEADSPLK